MPSCDNESRSAAAPRYILITQCLQNDFFLNRGCRLRLPDSQVARMLVGRNGGALEPGNPGAKLPAGYPQKGPLGLFLRAAVGARLKATAEGSKLHVINIRDWHSAGSSYDKERNLYGPHCEAETWGAGYLEGIAEYLAGGGDPCSAFHAQGNARFYHILSDYIFDFKPHSSALPHVAAGRKFHRSPLENILDVLLVGDDQLVEKLGAILSGQPLGACREELQSLAKKAVTSDGPSDLYVAVIGVYTDIKVKTILSSLRARYEIPNLAVSDTLTASPTLERHLEALDFAQKVLGVQVIHGLNDLVRFLGGDATVSNESEVVDAPRFADYSSFFQDKQNVLAYEREKLQDYLCLTQQRAERVYRFIEWGNRILIASGTLLLLITAAAAIISLFSPSSFDWKLPVVTGGLGLLQMVTSFFSKPMKDMQQNLNNMATFRMMLETHSLKTSLARFHLTTPQLLREKVDSEEAAVQVAALKAQFEALDTLERDYRVLKELGFGVAEKDAALARPGSANRGKSRTKENSDA